MKQLIKNNRGGYFRSVKLAVFGLASAAALLFSATHAKDQPVPDDAASAIFAAGCFWCIEKDFELHDGVYAVYSGYSGGEKANPTYKEVASGQTKHREVVQVWYDQDKLSYEDLVNINFRNLDPYNDRGQFCDNGFQYTGAIYPANAAEQDIAERVKAQLEAKQGREFVTEIERASPFYLAEDYHQNFYEKSPLRYTTYRFACGRDGRLNDIWADEARAEHRSSHKG